MFKNRRPLSRRFFIWMAAITAALAAAAGAYAMTKDEVRAEQAMFGAGCFWGVEKIFAQVPGVLETSVGYAGGSVPDPGYETVTTGLTGHAEVVHLKFDPSKLSYAELLEVFWKYHDPTTIDRQGPDVGSQYRSVIFTYSAAQERTAKAAIRILDAAKVYDKPIVTEVVPAAPFYKAEEYHQKYLQKNPNGYCSHRLLRPALGAILREGLAAEPG